MDRPRRARGRDPDDERDEWQPQRSLTDRAAIYGVPALAGLVTAAVLLGPGGERTVEGARARGVLCAGANRFALRLHALAHQAGVHARVDGAELVLELRDADRSIGSWRGATDARGVAEAQGTLAMPLGDAVELVLARGEGTRVRATVATGAPLAASEAQLELDGTVSGALPIRVRAPRGFAVAPFPEPLMVTVTAPAAVSAPLLDIEATGADVSEPIPDGRPRCSDDTCRHGYLFRLTAQAPSIALRIGARAGSVAGRWEGAVPVVTGAPWLDPDTVLRGDSAFRSALPKAQLYLSLYGLSGRLWGARVPMLSEPNGFSHGKLSLPPMDEPALELLVSGDEDEPEATSAGYAIGGTGVEVRPLGLLLDGLPPLVAAERERRLRARWPAFALVAAAALFELAYLWRRHRMARADIAERMRAASGGEAALAVTARAPVATIFLIACALALAFATFVALIVLVG